LHFFYLDESGDTGRNLLDPDQPIMVLGGISLRDEGWITTRERFDALIRKFFGNSVPADFELHAKDLLSPSGDGAFAGRSMDERCGLVSDVLDLLEDRKHGVHFIAFDKPKVHATPCGSTLAFNPSRPYLLGFDYLITYINWYVKEKLGSSARGMIIADEKENYHDDVERIVRNRRREGPVTHRVKWIVEITYPVDSKRNPMIQVSDLVIYCVRRFLEMDAGYRDDWPDAAKQFYAHTYNRIIKRVDRIGLVERGGREVKRLNEYLEEVRVMPQGQWRRRHGLT
jgi:hypothetical protein